MFSSGQAKAKNQSAQVVRAPLLWTPDLISLVVDLPT